MKQSTVAGLAALALALLAALFAYQLSDVAGWMALVAAVLVGFGVFGGARGPTGVGVGLLAVASLFATADEGLWWTLGISALMAIVCLVVLVVVDLSFAMRRETVVSSATLQGWFAVHAVASALGIGLAVLLVAGVLAVSWPGWLLLLPGIALVAGSIAMTRQAIRYNRKLRPAPASPGQRQMPPAPPLGIRSSMPPPPAPGAQPSRWVPPPPR